MDRHFADDLVRHFRLLGHPLCVGLDPHLRQIPRLFGEARDPRDPRTAETVERFLGAVVERLDGRVAVVKPQIAFFEALGWRGLRLLEAVIAKARAAGLRVLLDAKRGDIGSTAAAYAAAYLGGQADALTVSPYLGLDSLAPFLDAASSHGGGLFVLVKTSNPGSGDFQDLEVDGGGTLYQRVAARLAEPAAALRGPATGWSSLGVVVGATHPGTSERVREALPHSLFLVPGYGAQGGSAADAVRGFVPGPGGRLEGGLVNSSRGVLFPEAGSSAGARRWEQAIDDALDRAIDELSAAVA